MGQEKPASLHNILIQIYIFILYPLIKVGKGVGLVFTPTLTKLDPPHNGSRCLIPNLEERGT